MNNSRKFSIIILCVLCFNTFLFADKKSETDSLRVAYKNARSQDDKLSSLNKLCHITKYSDFQAALIYGQKGIALAQKLNDLETEAKIHNNLGLGYKDQANFEESFKQYTIALDLYKELEHEEMQGVMYNNFGLLYHGENNYAEELTYHHKALDVFDRNNLLSRQAMSYVNIGRVYITKKDYKKGADYFVKSYKIYDELNDDKRVVTCLNNIASVYLYSEELELSSFYFDKNLELLETLEGVDRSKAMVLYNSSGVLILLKKYKEAEERLMKSLALCESFENKESLAICYHNFGNLYLAQEDYEKAKTKYLKSFELSVKTKIKELEIENYKKLAIVYEHTNSYKEAYINYKKYFSIKDSIFNKQIEQVNEVERKYIEEKSARELEVINVAKQKEEHQSDIIKIVGSAIILVLFMIILSIVVKYRDKKKSNLLLGEKNKEITDSIQYAKRIQNAILPSNKVVAENLKESFILYKPKDIVAGDFYWMESIASTNNNKEQIVLFAAADCTGHGVPGAMVSVVCNNALNRSVREHGLTDPGEILDKAREIVIQEFEKSDEVVQDGMDIALCSIEGNTLKYAGAHNPLWIIRKGEILETKADKQPIGQFDHPQPYTTHTIELQ
ncbi:MAG: tetratricopeptide repeat protein, partial [Flavobacteriales bacterium]|nr:tetratricopeptide repeat protein [Flavobacteriales bacterium]